MPFALDGSCASRLQGKTRGPQPVRVWTTHSTSAASCASGISWSQRSSPRPAKSSFIHSLGTFQSTNGASSIGLGPVHARHPGPGQSLDHAGALRCQREAAAGKPRYRRCARPVDIAHEPPEPGHVDNRRPASLLGQRLNRLANVHRLLDLSVRQHWAPHSPNPCPLCALGSVRLAMEAMDGNGKQIPGIRGVSTAPGR